ncbi:MAG: hypothetical protein ACO244_04380 [Ilumatobacteraceae bacterium]|jgi:ribosomal protein S27E
MQRKRRITATMCLAMLATLATTRTTHAVVEWELTDDPVSLGMSGVSPHVEKTASGDRVWRSDGPSGTVVSICTEAGVCTAETFSTGTSGPINDVTIARTKTGQLRAYFKQVEPSTNTQTVYSAPCNDANCLSLGAATITSTGMRVSKDIRAWGVPDAVVLPNGDIRIYITESPVEGRCTEKIASYTSADGISFTKDAGWRLEGGYVDTEMLRVKDGEWLMILADIACTSSNNQKLFISTSADGLTWTTPVAITGSGPSRLDPTGYETATNVFRIYYSQSENMNSFTVKRATLRIKDTAKGGGVGITTTPKVTTPSSKSKTITCVKGKITRKVIGTKCPAGFKKK